MAAEHGAGNFVFNLGDETEPGIAHEVGGDGVARIRFIETHALAGLPEGKHRVVVGGRQGSQYGCGRCFIFHSKDPFER